MMSLSNSKPVYHVFGLNIESEIPFLDMLQVNDSPDVTIRYGRVPDTLPGPRIKGGRYQAGPREFLLRVDNVARYYVSNGNSILVERSPGAGDEEVLLFLMVSAMGALLHQRKMLPIHGSSIMVEDKGVIFVGPSQVGKSTLAAGLCRRGYPLLSDDICAISASDGGIPEILPGFPWLLLPSDALNRLEENKKGFKRVLVDQNSERYFVPFYNAWDRPVSVRSVFVLGISNTHEFKVTGLRGRDKIDQIINSTYMLRFLDGLGGKKEHFKQCAAVAAKVAVFKITRPKEGFLLQEIMCLTEENF